MAPLSGTDVTSHVWMSHTPHMYEVHLGHTDVQEYGCRALTNLAGIDDIKTAIAAAGGIPVVLAAMTAHLGQTYCIALCYIRWLDTTLQKRIKEEGGVAVVQATVATSGATVHTTRVNVAGQVGTIQHTHTCIIVKWCHCLRLPAPLSSFQVSLYCIFLKIQYVMSF